MFLSKLEMIGVPFDLSLEILSEMRRTKGNIPKEKYKEWGFADSYSIGYVELQYKLTREGMTVEQLDYLDSDARLSQAISITVTNLISIGISVVSKSTAPQQTEADLNSQVAVETEKEEQKSTVEPKAENSKIPWNSWENYEKVTVNGKTYAKVGDRLYSKHAVGRMQPSGNRFGPNIYQDSATETYGRSIAPQYVEYVINSTNPIFQSETGNYIYRLGTVCVAVNPEGAVVTIMTYQ